MTWVKQLLTLEKYSLLYETPVVVTRKEALKAEKVWAAYINKKKGKVSLKIYEWMGDALDIYRVLKDRYLVREEDDPIHFNFIKTNRGIEAAIAWTTTDDGKTLNITDLCSAPWNIVGNKDRKGGGASKLIYEVMKIAIANKKITLVAVSPLTDSKPFYTKFGFKETDNAYNWIIDIIELRKWKP